MATNEKKQPGVEVTQKQKTNSNNIFNPSLVPFVCGPAKEIIKAFDESGSLNPNALQGTYTQLPKTISQTSFPSPRGNIKEVSVEKDTIRPFINFSGNIKELPRDPGESFLLAYNKSTRACFRSDVQPNNGWDLNPNTGAKILSFVIDQPIRNNNTADKAVTFTSTNNALLTTQQVCDQINAVWGKEIAVSVTLSGESLPRVQITSTKYGALSSVTIRAGGTANAVLGFSTSEERIEGSGFRGQDQNDATTQTPYIEYYRGQYYLNAVAAAFPGGGTGKKYGLLDENNKFINDKDKEVIFSANGLDIKVGDEIYADGIKVKNGYVMKVDDSRIKMGTLNTTLTTYDANGKIVSPVYDVAKVTTIYDPVPFAPRYVWFMAKNLTYPSNNAVAAVLTGSNSGAAAESATVTGSANVTDFGVSGLTLKYTLTIDNVEQPETTITFTGTFADLNAIRDYINGLDSNILASNSGGSLRIRTVKTGQTQKIKIGLGTANTKLFLTTSENTTFVGKDVEFTAQPATLIQATNQTFNLDILNGEKITLEVSNDNFSTVTAISYTWPANTTYNNITDLLTALNTNVIGTAPNNVVWSNTSGKLTVKTVTHKGKLAGVRVKSVLNDNTALGAGKILLAIDATANGINGLQGETFKFKLNDRTKIYNIVFLTNSLIDAITEINNAVGITTASVNTGSVDKLVLTSALKGKASKVEVLSDSVSLQTVLALGFVSPNDVALGSGRPNPDFYLDVAGNVVLGAEMLRHPITGYPYDPASAQIYIQYRGLRKDVSPVAKNPDLLRIGDIDTLTAVLSPITEENPLALAMYFQLLNAPNRVCTGLGVDEISATEPEGTIAAYQRVADFIQAQEIYTIAPLTQNEAVHSIFRTHVDDMSLPEKKSERVVFINPKIPVRKVDTTIATGLAANTILNQSNIITIDVNPVVALQTNGINAALPIDYSSQLFVVVTVNNAVRRYSVSLVNGVVISLRTSFGAGQNTDGFYSTTALTETVANSTWGMYIRGVELLIPGSTLPDKTAIASTVNDKSAAYLDRRVRYVFPETVQAPIGGITKNIPAYYAAAAYTGVIAYQTPQQGLTNFKINGFTGALNTRGYFNRKQLDIIAGGGTWILINDNDGLPIYARQQLTTDVRTVESQEQSIVTIVDHAAKLIRSLLRQFIGTNNVSAEVMDSIGTLLDGIRKFLVEDLRSLVDMRVNSIEQDSLHPDTVKIDIQVKVPYPLNYINVTIWI